MAAINGIQLARLWARAWKGLPGDTTFKVLLETDPLTAAKQFKTECDATPATHAPFPDPTQLQLLDFEEYGQPGLDFKKMPKDKLKKIADGVDPVPWWIRSKFLIISGDLVAPLKNGELEIRTPSDDEHY